MSEYDLNIIFEHSRKLRRGERIVQIEERERERKVREKSIGNYEFDGVSSTDSSYIDDYEHELAQEITRSNNAIEAYDHEIHNNERTSPNTLVSTIRSRSLPNLQQDFLYPKHSDMFHRARNEHSPRFAMKMSESKFHKNHYEFGRRRHLAEGAIGGAAAFEINRHHRRRQGENPVYNLELLEHGALGAVGAEGVSNTKRWDRRNQSRSWSRGRGSQRKNQRRSRSIETPNTGSSLAGLGAMGSATRNRREVKIIRQDRRSRSRHRNVSITHRQSEEDIRYTNLKHLDHNAVAGTVDGAASLVQHFRTRSSTGRSRSRSRIRQSIPIAAAGLGSVAVTGLYEKRKRKRQSRSRSLDENRSRSVSRSRSRSNYDFDFEIDRGDACYLYYGKVKPDQSFPSPSLPDPTITVPTTPGQYACLDSANRLPQEDISGDAMPMPQFKVPTDLSGTSNMNGLSLYKLW
jgi:hypothetical protein